MLKVVQIFTFDEMIESFENIILVGAIKCFSCELTKGYVINSGHWGVNNCNDFENSSAKDCSPRFVGDEAPTFCRTSVESYDQEDFSGFRETRACGSKQISGRGIQHIQVLFFIISESRESV